MAQALAHAGFSRAPSTAAKVSPATARLRLPRVVTAPTGLTKTGPPSEPRNAEVGLCGKGTKATQAVPFPASRAFVPIRFTAPSYGHAAEATPAASARPNRKRRFIEATAVTSTPSSTQKERVRLILSPLTVVLKILLHLSSVALLTLFGAKSIFGGFIYPPALIQPCKKPPELHQCV